MDKHKRGSDRRAYRAASALTTDERERREGSDRRRHGYISKLDLCCGLPYEILEPIFERCPITELAADTAALFMVQAVTLLRVEMNKSTDLVTAMTRINRALCETNISHMFVSLIVATIDTRTGVLTYVNAGHPPFLAAQGDGPFAAVETSVGLIAGVLEDTVYETGELTLGAGDRLLLYTDGISEARVPARKFYGAARLRAFLNTRPVTDATGCVNALFDDVLQFTGGMPQSDDVTALAVTFRF